MWIGRCIKLRIVVAFLVIVASVQGGEAEGLSTPTSAGRPPANGWVFPNSTNSVQFCLFTDASPAASHVVNTFEVEAYGQTLLRSPNPSESKQSPAGPASTAFLHNVLINGNGPILAGSNSLVLVERASGPGWQYAEFDGTSAYEDRVKDYRRSVLFVEPDLFVIYDHVAAEEPVGFKMLLHPPAATVLDTNWGDLRLKLPDAGFRINAPSRDGALRSWERLDSVADALLPGTVTMSLSPTNQLRKLDLLTVIAVYPAGRKSGFDYYSFKLLESNNAIGARIHRAGLPTLVAFNTNPTVSNASLHGFEFNGPVGVHVFQPKRRAD